ncbi:MAG: hypothetical protein ACTHN5_09105 [Phycisphaerae bacterium]
MTTVFYAWQSDRDPEVCKKFIRRAAKLAIKKLAAEAEVKSAPPFDMDEATKDVPGHPHIAMTIRRKIRTCGCFLADLTHVAEYESADGRKKRAQNGNVQIELGIAIRAKGFAKLIMVMNEHFGPPEDLPFDLKSHSFPITYRLAPNSDHAIVELAKRELANRIAEKLKPILKLVKDEENNRALEYGPSREWLNSVIFEHRQQVSRVRNREFFNMTGNRCILIVNVVPQTEPSSHLAFTEGFLFERNSPIRPLGQEVGLPKSTTYSVGQVYENAKSSIQAVTELRNNGFIHGAWHLLWSDEDDTTPDKMIRFDARVTSLL